MQEGLIKSHFGTIMCFILNKMIYIEIKLIAVCFFLNAMLASSYSHLKMVNYIRFLKYIFLKYLVCKF